MNIDDMFAKYNRSLEPSPGQEERVKEKIFSRIGKKKFNLLSLTHMKFLFNKKFLIGSSLGILLVIFIGMPLLFTMNGPMRDMDVSTGGLPLFTNNSSESAVNNEDKGKSDEYLGYSPSSNGVDNDTDTDELNRAKEMTGTLSMIVDDSEKKMGDISHLIIDLDGYIQSSKLSQYSNSRRYATITFKVPASKFERAIISLKDMAVEIESENITSVDRQDELTSYTKSIDELKRQIENLESKLAAEKDEYKRSDLVYQINSLKSQKDALEKSLSQLSNKTTYSTLTVTIVDKAEEVDQLSSFEKSLEKSKGILQFWQEVGYNLIPLSLICLPPLVLFAIVIISFKFFRKKPEKK